MPMKITRAHELDAGWIIALWKAIHGGDPSPIEVDERSAELVGELVNHLGRTVGRGAQPLTVHAFEARLSDMGIQLQRHARAGTPGGAQSREAAAQSAPEEPQREPLPYCFVFKGTSYCVHFPHRVFTVE